MKYENEFIEMQANIIELKAKLYQLQIGHVFYIYIVYKNIYKHCSYR